MDSSGRINQQNFRLNLSREEYLLYYRGNIKWIQVNSETGLKLKFPASCLSQFVTHTGVHGRFQLSFTEQGKFISIHKLSP